MKIKCLGASQEVGRSAFLIKGSSNILLDYGLKQIAKYRKKSINTPELHENAGIKEPLKVKEYIDAIILSHAHLDHSGDIPSLYKKDSPNLFLTEATLDLSNLLWRDTLKISKFEKQEPPFKKKEIYEANKSAFILNLKQTTEISDTAKLTFYNSGHIVGSVISVIEMDGKKIMYSGDFRNIRSSLFEGYDTKLPEVDYLIMETTYGIKNHKPREKIEEELIGYVKNTLARKGSVILAAFAIERTQELLTLLYNYKIKAPIYIDGMGIKTTKIFLENEEYIKDIKTFRKAVKNTQFVTSNKIRKNIVKSNEPKIIITTAGMLEGGPAIFYIKELGEDENNLLMTTGYQVEGTNGDYLKKNGKLHINNKLFKPNCELKFISLSAHPGKNGLLKLVENVKPKKVICVHGDPENIIGFSKLLKEKGYKTETPKIGEEIEL